LVPEPMSEVLALRMHRDILKLCKGDRKKWQALYAEMAKTDLTIDLRLYEVPRNHLPDLLRACVRLYGEGNG
jgi:hypothetical protein